VRKGGWTRQRGGAKESPQRDSDALGDSRPVDRSRGLVDSSLEPSGERVLCSFSFAHTTPLDVRGQAALPALTVTLAALDLPPRVRPLFTRTPRRTPREPPPPPPLLPTGRPASA
jgi:hypothetical protein